MIIYLAVEHPPCAKHGTRNLWLAVTGDTVAMLAGKCCLIPWENWLSLDTAFQPSQKIPPGLQGKKLWKWLNYLNDLLMPKSEQGYYFDPKRLVPDLRFWGSEVSFMTTLSTWGAADHTLSLGGCQRLQVSGCACFIILLVSLLKWLSLCWLHGSWKCTSVP